MKQKTFRTKLGILAIAMGALLLGMFFVFVFSSRAAFAFVGPGQTPPNGNGAIGSDSSNNVSIGTSTTISSTKLLIVGASSDNTTYAEQVLSSNNTPIFILRDDGSISIETSTISAGNTIIGGDLTVGGTFTASNLGGSTITAGNVSSGQFGSNTGGGNYSFSGNVSSTGICLSGVCNATWPNNSQWTTSGSNIYYNGGNVGIGTTSPSQTLSVAGNAMLSAGNPYLYINGTYSAIPNLASIGIRSAGEVVMDSNTNNDAIANWEVKYGTGTSINPEDAFYVARAVNATGTLSYFLDINSSGNVGIGTTAPAFALDMAAGDAYGYNGYLMAEASTSRNSYFFGGAGNLTATGAYNTGVGYYALHTLTTGGGNTGVGYYALEADTVGPNNTATGIQALQNTYGSNNTADGYRALLTDSGGGYNTAVGYEALYANSTASGNTAVGYGALVNNIAANNTANGEFALGTITSGGGNAAMGYQAGKYISGGSTSNLTSNSSTYLGSNTWALASGDTNETVIGSGAVGNGSNTVTLGGTGTTGTIIPYGNVGIGTTAPSSTLSVNGVGSSGTGIFGSGSSYGIYGSGGSYGVYGVGSDGIYALGTSNIGLNANGINIGVVGGGNEGVYGQGNGTSGIGVYGYGGGGASARDFSGYNGEYTSGGTWTNASARDLKEYFTPVDDQTILNKIIALPITKWVYKTDDTAWHIGPVAEDFYASFGLGDNNKSISTIDPASIALVGVKALDEKINTQQQEIDALQSEVQQLLNK